MKNKKLFIGLTLSAALIVPFSVFSATSDSPVAQSIRHFLRIDVSKLNDSQKADVKAYQEKMANVQKDFVNQMIANGSITKEDGNAEIAKIDKSLKNGTGVNGLPGLGGGMRNDGQKGGRGFGMFDLSKLTDTQKADLKASHTAMLKLQKEYIAKMISNGLLTKAQGDADSKKLDEVISNIDKEDVTKGPGLMMRGFGGFGPKADNSKLTDAQKSDMTEFNTKMQTLQKEMINKMVSNGAITKEQGDNLINRMTSKPNFEKGQFDRQGGHRRGPESQDASAPEVQ